MENNELYVKLLKAIVNTLNKWLKSHSGEDRLIIAQQLALVGVELREMASRMEEDYKANIGR